MIKKLIRYDMLEGYRQHGWKLLVAVLLGVLFCIDFRMRMTNLFPELQTDMGDFIIYAIGGMKIYTPSPVEKFEFPVRWILYYSFLFYATLQYAENDMRGMGKQMIVRSGKRKYWWTAKLLWNISYVVVWMAVFYVTIAAYCLISGVSLNLSVHPDTVNMICQNTVCYNFVSWQAICQLCVQAIFAAVAISVFQTGMTLVIKPQFAFLVTEIYLVASAYLVHPVLIGNTLMPMRNCIVMEGGWQSTPAFIMVIAIMAIGVGLGYIKFRKHSVM